MKCLHFLLIQRSQHLFQCFTSGVTNIALIMNAIVILNSDSNNFFLKI